MAEQKSRIYSLPEITEINNDMYLMLDASDTGARRFNLKTFYDKVDGVQASADAANTAATAAAAAVDSANQAAQQAASAAESASTTVQGLVEDVNEAIEAVGDVTELAVPTMSSTVKGGAKLGTGLEVTDGTLSVNTVSSGDGSQAGPILSLDAKGWAEQDTTTGKNLLPNIKPKTSSGVTISVGENGKYTLNGTATANTFLTAAISIPAGTYTMSANNPTTDKNVIIRLEGSNISQETVSAQLNVANAAKTITTPDTATAFVIRIANGATLSNFELAPQLELGSTATSYEPYTGGAPSPSPDYPQEIRVCSGRNLIDPSLTIRNAFLNNNTTRITEFDGATVYVAKVKKNTTYTISSKNSDRYELAGFAGAQMQIGDIYTVIDRSNVSDVHTFNSGNFEYVGVYLYSSAKFGQESSVQLERGSVATPYVPYGYVGLEAQGKNLWDGGDRSISGTTKYISADVDIPSGTYFISADVEGEAETQRVSFRDGSSVSITTVQISALSNGRKGALVVLGETAKRVYLYGGQNTSATGSETSISNIQLERNDHATPYQPYHHSTTPIPLPSRGWIASLPDGTCDTLTLDGAGKVTWEKNVAEEIWNGSESWGLSSDPRRFTYNNTNDVPRTESANTELFSHFVYGNTNNHSFGVARINTAGYRVVPDSDGAMETAGAFKTWLSTHPVTVLYPLATPVTEERGYVENWPTNLPSGCQISIPELDDLNIRYHIDESVMEIARQWYEKARSEYAEELAELRMTVNELATRVQ